MRSRIAILFMLVSGFALSGAGAGLAVSGIVGDSTASVAQYDGTNTTPNGGETPTLLPPAQGVAGEETTGEAPASEPKPESENRPADKVAGETDEQPTQVTRQLSADTSSGDELPFTGFAAIPVLLIGVFLLASGFVLRRGNRNSGA